MKRVLCTLIILLISSSIRIKACDCADMGGFAYSSQYSNLVIIGSVVKDDSSKNLNSIRIKVLEKIRGLHVSDTIMVVGGNGAGCRVSTSVFQQDETWLLALNTLSSKNEYEIFSCGNNYIKIQDSILIGDFKRSPWENPDSIKVDTINLNTAKELLNHPSFFTINHEQHLLEEKGLFVNCECPPLCPATNQDSLNSLISNIIKSDKMLSKEESYLIHIKLLIYKKYIFLSYNGLLQEEFGNQPDFIKTIDERLKKGLRKIRYWKEGSKLYNDVLYEVYMPVIIKN